MKIKPDYERRIKNSLKKWNVKDGSNLVINSLVYEILDGCTNDFDLVARVRGDFGYSNGILRSETYIIKIPNEVERKDFSGDSKEVKDILRFARKIYGFIGEDENFVNYFCDETNKILIEEDAGDLSLEKI